MSKTHLCTVSVTARLYIRLIVGRGKCKLSIKTAPSNSRLVGMVIFAVNKRPDD